jgi:hypothetical protein
MLPALSARARSDVRRHFSVIDQWMNRMEDASPVEGSDEAVLLEP